MGGVELGLGVALLAAFASIVTGRHLTRSIVAGAISLAGLALALTSSGAGFVGFFVLTVGASVLATIQLFGWMLVDVDRDHLPPTDRVTAIARGIAFLLLGAGLVLLVALGLEGGVSKPISGSAPMASPREIGERFFGVWRDLATICGIALSAGLLATLMTLRDDGENR
ncbi:MAG: hypothetical protein GY910_09410 [bacterium]|nr:hypothetical protein [Deltaproteobacteria bacterium]MCP4905186.1 hypothetical protein [bacterium]